MTLGEAVKFLMDNNYQINSVKFTHPNMRGEYCPQELSYRGTILTCLNLRNGSKFDWAWSTSGSIKNRYKIGKVTVDRDGRHSRLVNSRKIVTLHLQEVAI